MDIEIMAIGMTLDLRMEYEPDPTEEAAYNLTDFVSRTIDTGLGESELFAKILACPAAVSVLTEQHYSLPLKIDTVVKALQAADLPINFICEKL